MLFDDQHARRPQPLIVAMSSDHTHADFTPIAHRVIVAKAPGPMAVDPADLPWQRLPSTIRRSP